MKLLFQCLSLLGLFLSQAQGSEPQDTPSPPAVTLNSTADLVSKDDSYTITCSISSANVYDDLEVIFQFSSNRLTPTFTTFAQYSPIKRMAPNLVEESDEITDSPTRTTPSPTQYDFSPTFNSYFSVRGVSGSPVYPVFRVNLEAKTDDAAGVYRCLFQSQYGGEYLSNEWAASYTFASQGMPSLPKANITRELTVNTTGMPLLNCTATVEPKADYSVGVRLGKVALGEFKVSHGAPAVINWTTLETHDQMNLFPQQVTDYPIFPVLIDTRKSAKYLKENLQCYLRVSPFPVAQPGLRTLYLSDGGLGNGATDGALLSSLLFGVALITAGKFALHF